MNKREALIAMLNGERVHHVNDNKDPLYFFDGLNFIEEYKKSGRAVFNIEFLESNGFKIYEPEKNNGIERLIFVQNEEVLPKLIDTINKLIDEINKMKAREK